MANERKSIAFCVLVAGCLCGSTGLADTPATSYIFPAGGQRGTTVQFRVGGLYLFEGCPFEMLGTGVEAAPRIERTKTVWFEGPVIPIPDSQRQEDYPKDYAGRVKIAADAPPGARAWRVSTAQGAVAARAFIIGDLPEIVEEEIDGAPLPVAVRLPVTINGRIFPREDIDLWSFEARAGQSITCAVLAGKLGSPLEPRVEIVDPHGRCLAESSEAFDADALVRFTAPDDGTYQARIHDINFSGLQPYVYRLTITAGPYVDRAYPLGGPRGKSTRFDLSGQGLPNQPVEIALPAGSGEKYVHTFQTGGTASNPFVLDTSDFPEALETEPNDEAAQVQAVDLPAVFNGRIGRAGDADFWAFRGAKGAVYDFDLQAARLGSPLDSVLTLLDSTGKELARNDDASGSQSDSQFRFTIPADGVYCVRVEERLASRGGPAFAYRLRVAPPPAPDFRLHFAADKNQPGGDALTLNRGGQAKLKLQVERLGGFDGEIKLDIENLPAGVSTATASIPAKANQVDIALKAEATAKIQAAAIKVRGTATLGDKMVTKTATARLAAADAEIDSVLLAVALPTPFKIKGVFETKYAHRGSVFVRHYAIDRGGFAGPFQVEMADKQFRHLQGVTGPAITVPAGVSEFDYPVYLPPWMEIGRTSRTVVALVGTVEEADGTKHKVSSTSVDQNDQIIVLVDPERLSLEIDRRSLAAIAAGEATLAVRIGRGAGMNGPVKVELLPPAHVRGVEAAPLTIPPGQTTGTLTVKFARENRGPFNQPLILRATLLKDDKSPVIGETTVQVVEPASPR